MAIENAVLIFKTTQSRFAINATDMIEIIEMIEMRPMPNSPMFIKGLINYRSKIVPVCDLNYLFEGKEQPITINTPIIMVSIGNKPVGFIVEDVSGVQVLNKEDKVPLTEETQDYVVDAFQDQESVLLIIDLAKVFKKADAEVLETHLGTISEHQETVRDCDQSLMHQRAISLSKSMTKTKKVITKYICFKANNEYFGLNIEYVDTVLKVQKVHWVPGLPDFILGVFNKRGEVVSVTDFQAFMGLGKSEVSKKSGLIVVKDKGMETALLVDEVVGVVDVLKGQIQPPPAVLNKEQSEYVQGEVHLTDSLLVIINGDKLLSAKKLSLFEAVS